MAREKGDSREIARGGPWKEEVSKKKIVKKKIGRKGEGEKPSQESGEVPEKFKKITKGITCKTHTIREKEDEEGRNLGEIGSQEGNVQAGNSSEVSGTK